MANQTVTVSNDADFRTALAAGYAPDQITIDTSDVVATARAEGLAAGKAEGKTEGVDEGRTLGVQAERDRISAITAATADGFEKQRDEAIKAGTSAGDFKSALYDLIRDRGITKAAIQKDSPAAAHAAPGEGPKSSWDSVVARHSKKA